MNRKINTICFIFLFFFLICAASAADNENETQQTISPDLNDNQEIYSACDNKIIKTNAVENTKAELGKMEKAVGSNTPAKQKVSLTAANVNMYYNDGHKFNVIVKDQNKKPLNKISVKIKINGKTYVRQTNKGGKASIDLNLNSGSYSVITTFDGTDTFEKASIKSTVTIKSTIKASDFTKYYKNTNQYCAKFYDKNGKSLKNTIVKFQINSKTYRIKTDNTGTARLKIDLKPSKVSITAINPETREKVSRTITIKTLIKTHDLTMNESDGSEFKVKIIDCNGKASPNKLVRLKVDSDTYTKMTDKNGEIKLPISLKAGTYTITTEFLDLKVANRITVNKITKTPTSIRHVTSIPNYVNITLPYVYPNEKYSLETGANGIVKMPKIEVFTVEIGENVYQYATGKTGIGDVITMEEKSYLVPFKGCLVSSKDKNLLPYDGIMITRTADSTEIEYRSSVNGSVELFGFYANKGNENSEVLTYMQNDKKVARVTIQTQYFDETGVKYSLARHYKRVNLDFPYYEITNHIGNPIKFTNTGKPVEFSYFQTYIVGYCSKEEITTRFIINGKEELEKKETISYGRGEKFRKTLGFEVLQAYTIISEKITQKTVEDWISKNPDYLNKFGVMNVYGMHLASLETAWLADMLADDYAKDFNVNWKRSRIVTILGGINLEDTYLHIMNADMAMKVVGNNETNVKLFRLMNSINLPKIEEYCLKNIADRYMDNTTNSLDRMMNSIESNKFSVAEMGELFYILCEDGGNSAIIVNSTSGLANVIMVKDGFAYKGAGIKTTCDCCSIGIMPQDIIKGIQDTVKNITDRASEFISDIFKNKHPLIRIAINGATSLLALAGNVITTPTIVLSSIVAPMISAQTISNKIKNELIPKEDWHYAYDHFTFTRGGYLQGKKVYNIPKEDGSFDYIEVAINKDDTLDRNNALYISNKKTKKLTKQETYQYFDDETWTPFSVPQKYWDKSWNV